MKKRLQILALLAALVTIGGCGGRGGDAGPETYSTSLTGIQLQKKGNGEPLPVGNLPVDGATITRE